MGQHASPGGNEKKVVTPELLEKLSKLRVEAPSGRTYKPAMPVGARRILRFSVVGCRRHVEHDPGKRLRRFGCDSQPLVAVYPRPELHVSARFRIRRLKAVDIERSPSRQGRRCVEFNDPPL
jgi:hypothetical protein